MSTQQTLESSTDAPGGEKPLLICQSLIRITCLLVERRAPRAPGQETVCQFSKFVSVHLTLLGSSFGTAHRDLVCQAVCAALPPSACPLVSAAPSSIL